MQLPDRGYVLPTRAVNNHGFTLIIAPPDPSIRALFISRLSSSSSCSSPLVFLCPLFPFSPLCACSIGLTVLVFALLPLVSPSVLTMFPYRPLHMCSFPLHSPPAEFPASPLSSCIFHHRSRKMGCAPCGCPRLPRVLLSKKPGTAQGRRETKTIEEWGSLYHQGPAAFPGYPGVQPPHFLSEQAPWCPCLNTTRTQTSRILHPCSNPYTLLLSLGFRNAGVQDLPTL